MKKLLLLSLIASSPLVGEQPHATFIPRPVSSFSLITDVLSAPPEEPAGRRVLSCSHTLFLQDSGYASKSAPFFLGNKNKSIAIREDELGDINSDWFHIESESGAPYVSALTVAPQRSTIGVCMRAQFLLDDLLKGLWFAAVVPVLHTTHTLNVSEKLSPTTRVSVDSQFSSVVPALDWDNWRAGKWSSAAQSRVGVDDITFQMGINIDGPLHSVQQFTIDCLLPVSDRPTGQYLFEPLVGSQGSVGLGGSVRAAVPLLHLFENCTLSYVSHLSYRYHFSTVQNRLFDLKGQPFSRFLVYMDTDLLPSITNVAIKASNGPNFFLRDTTVKPGATGQTISALRLSFRDKFTVNGGYLYWWRTAEQVAFAGPQDRAFAVPSPQGLSTGDSPAPVWLTGAQITDSFSVLDRAISTSPALVQDVEFDLDSGAMRQVDSHTIFVDFCGSFIGDMVSCNFRLGGGYEFGASPAVLDSLHMWCGLGITI